MTSSNGLTTFSFDAPSVINIFGRIQDLKTCSSIAIVSGPYTANIMQKHFVTPIYSSQCFTLASISNIPLTTIATSSTTSSKSYSTTQIRPLTSINLSSSYSMPLNSSTTFTSSSSSSYGLTTLITSSKSTSVNNYSTPILTTKPYVNTTLFTLTNIGTFKIVMRILINWNNDYKISNSSSFINLTQLINNYVN